MIRTTFGLVILALILGALPAPVGAVSCFRCEQWEDSSGWWKHEDGQLFFNEWKGDPHPNSTWGSCSVHEQYGLQ